MEKIQINNKIRLYYGDCLEVLKPFPDNSIDSIVTDPPAGISFMGKEWDSDKGGRDQWIKWFSDNMKETFRVLKPGGHGLVWAIPRTSHWTATALENVGFEIRDVINHIFGTGFPKSMNISKAIDSKLGLTRVKGGVKPGHEEFVNRKTSGHITALKNFSTGEFGRPWMDDEEKRENYHYNTLPNSEEAKKWEGYGTALKPAAENWILIRKPISEKTIAENVLKWGVGGINIDDCRILTEENLNGGAYSEAGRSKSMTGDERQGKELGMFEPGKKPDNSYKQPDGRWPANIILDEESAKILDNQGEISLPKKSRKGKKGGSGFGLYDDEKSAETFGVWPGDNGGGVSRFFYIAKPSTKERNAGISDNKESVKVNDGRQTEIDNPFQRGETLRKNTHPTVKPISLMKYLIKLITPKNGICLDQYNGSGTTGCAIAELNKEGYNFKYIGIDMEKEYIDISIDRIKYYLEETK